MKLQIKVFFSTFPRLFWAVFSLMLFTQTNWILAHRYVYDLQVRMGAVFALALVATPVLFALTSIFLAPFFYRKVKSYFSWIAGFWTPLFAFLLHLPFYFGHVKYKPAYHAVIMVFTASLVVWIVTQISNRKAIAAHRDENSDPAKREMQETLVGPTPFWKGLWLAVTSGFMSLFKSVLSPAWITGKKDRLFFQPVLYPLFVLYGLLLIFRGLPLCTDVMSFFLLIITTVLGPVLLLNTLHALAGKNRVVLGFLNLLFYVVMSLLFMYHFNEGVPFDFSLAWENRDILVAPDSFTVYAARAQPAVVIGIFCFLAWMIVLQVRTKLFTRPTQKKRSVLFPLLWVILATPMTLTRVATADELVLLSRRMLPTMEEKKIKNETADLIPETFPYSRKSFPVEFGNRNGPRPDVFVVFLESFSRQWVERRTPEGKEVTPFLNQLLKEGLFIDNYYANTIQTSRALFVHFNGIYESFQDKTFHKFKNLLLRPLPVILDEQGYRTVFFNAHADINFDNKAFYLNKMGFKKIIPMTGKLIEGIPPEKFWNWGIQDDLFFERSFRWLDEYDPAERGKNRKPLFAVWLTLSQHRPHGRTPKNLRFIYPDAPSSDEPKQYANSEYLTDQFLKEFFRQLDQRPRYRDTIIIITSDHAYPIGLHSQNNEQGFYEENFRIPFLVIWRGKIKPRRVSDIAFNHTDFAPTILDLTGIDTPNHFIGQSVVSSKTQRSFCVNQPYDKKYLVGYNFPFKYAKSQLTGEEYLFNVRTDPDERNNLVLNPAYKIQLEQGRRTALQLVRNQILLEQNRVWDPRMLRSK